ncbi:MAG: DUF3616 domain-containing protein [Pyrinomonadaceae bacterium]
MADTSHSVLLKFDPDLDRLDEDKKLRDGLSAVVLLKDTLWVAGDETTRIERLSRETKNVFARHVAFPLSDYVTLPAGDGEEADIEGLDVADGYLWLVGSHSLKRSSPKPGKSTVENRRRLVTVKNDGNRFLLARIALEVRGVDQVLEKEVEQGTARIAGQLLGHKKGNELTAELAKDKDFAGFLKIPGKDNGLDIEGLAVTAGRVFVGLRGPVLRGWSTLLELAVRENPGDPSTLRLKKIGASGRLYRKHFLQLGGLGVRDLCVDGDDLLILAGPTMDLDGPVTVFRWRGGSKPQEESLIFGDVLEQVVDVPFGTGNDHAEGMTLMPPDNKGRRSVLILYDAPSKQRKKGSKGEAALRADIFELP